AELFLDAVLHLPAGAVELFVQRLRLPSLRTQRGHHKTRILFAVDVFGLGDHAPLPLPAAFLPLPGLVGELGKHPCRFAGLAPLLGGLPHLRPDDPPQSLVARQPEHVIDLILFTPAHQLIAAEARVPTQYNLHLRPRLRGSALRFVESPPDCLPPHRCWIAAGGHIESGLRRRCRAANSSSCHSNHGRISLPAGHARESRWRPHPTRFPPGQRYAIPKRSSPAVRQCPLSRT